MTIDRTTPRTPNLSLRGRRPLAIAVLVALLVLAAGIAVVRSGAGTDLSDASPRANTSSEASGATTESDLVSGLDSVDGTGDTDTDDDAVGVEETLQVGEVVPSSGESGGDGQGGELPGPEAEPSHPCDAVPVGRSLLVTPDPLHLEPTVMTSQVVVTNCGDAPVDWTAATVPAVTLPHDAGTLAPGEEVDVSFAIDESSIGAGAFDFKIKVSEPGANTYVDVHAFKGIINPAFVNEAPQLTAGPGSGGCALQCITKAWLSPNVSSANLSLEIATTVPAVLRVWVSTDAPVMTGDMPTFPGVDPIAANPAPTTSWTTPVAPLQPSTAYHIIVEATDEHDSTAHQVGTFTTIDPAVGPPELAPVGDVGGCAIQCIVKAFLTPVEGSSDTSIEVKSTVPAAMEVFVSTDTPAHDDEDVPYFPGLDPIAGTGGDRLTEWSADLTGLAGDTTHHIVVTAVDSDGRRSHRAGTFHTHQVEHTVLVTFHRIHVTYDGDGKHNRGELTFRLGVNGDKIAETAERKMHSGTTLHLEGPGRTRGVSHVVEGVGSTLPLLQVQGLERDADLKIELCPMGTGIFLAGWGRNEDCDVTWNTAGSGIALVDDLDGYPPCSSFGVGGVAASDRCTVISTADHGANYARFEVLVSYRLLD